MFNILSELEYHISRSVTYLEGTTGKPTLIPNLDVALKILSTTFFGYYQYCIQQQRKTMLISQNDKKSANVKYLSTMMDKL